MMRAQRQKKDDRDRHANEPQQHGPHIAFLSSLFPAAQTPQPLIVPPALRERMVREPVQRRKKKARHGCRALG
jgi:hypothetical protein